MPRNPFGVMLIACCAGTLGQPATVQADETQARQLVAAMSVYLAAQQAIAFDYDSTLEIVTADGQNLALASSGTVTLKRPDKIRAARSGGFADVETVFDGNTLTILGKTENVYARARVSGTVDELVDVLRDTLRRPLPAADLLMSDVAGQLMPQVVDAKDLGSGVIGGVECDHLAFRTPELDWQIWIAQGERPYPCRYLITSTQVTGWPQYSIDIRAWKTGRDAGADDFDFPAPAGARALAPGELPDSDELPGFFRRQMQEAD